MKPDDIIPCVTADVTDADREARLRSSRTGKVFFVGERPAAHGASEYLVALYADFRRFCDVGWLIHDIYGEPRDPLEDTDIYGADDYEDAILEAALRHSRGFSCYIGRRDGFVVAPPERWHSLERVGWVLVERFGSDGDGSA